MIMDDSAPWRRKLVKIYQNVLSQNWTVAAEVCLKIYSVKAEKDGENKVIHTGTSEITSQKKKRLSEREMKNELTKTIVW